MSEIMSELKPCPFCGEPVTLRKGFDYPNGEHSQAYICCKRRCVIYASKYKEDELIAAWNTRPIEDTLNKRIAELETILSNLCPIGDLSVIETLQVEKHDMMNHIAELEARLRWIPVGERLPIISKYYPVLRIDEQTQTLFQDTSRFSVDDERWFTNLPDVRYWFDLPEQPEVE